MYRQGEDVTRWEEVVDEPGSTERYEFGDDVCNPWRAYDGGDGGWVWVRVGVRVRVWDRKNKQEVVTALWKLWWKSGNWRQYPPIELSVVVQWMGRARKSGFFSR